MEVGELSRDYAEGGTKALSDEMTEVVASSNRLIFFRIADAGSHTLNTNGKWPPDALRLLEVTETGPVGQWMALSFGDDEGIDVITEVLSENRILQAGVSIKAREETLKAFRQTYIFTALVVLLLSLIGTVLLSQRILRPLSDLTIVTRRIAETGSVDTRVPYRDAGDELDDLARRFNGMLDRIGRLLSGMRETMDHVAHDLRTPMTRLRMRAEIALQQNDPSACRTALEGNLEDATQVIDILVAIMDEAEAEAGTLHLQREPVSLRTLVDEMVDLYEYVAEEKDIALEAVGVEVMASLDRNRMRQAIGNLIDNAVKYTQAGGRVAVEVMKEDHRAVVRIQDNGAGIDAEDLPRIWDRLYRGDHSRTSRGLGLGLSLVRAIVEAHGGSVEVVSTPGNGSAFTIRVPLQPASPL